MVKRVIPLVSVPVTGGGTASSALPLREQRLPRYTSYPPATEFKTLGENIHAKWLAELSLTEPVSLYLHIPFCKQLCLFCGCFTKITHHYAAIQEYLELLVREIEQVSQRIGGKLKVEHIHFGGGSPTVLEPEDFTRLMDVLYERFTIQPWAEIAIEIDPRTLNQEKCASYAYNGINRVSLGVQDFSPQVQTAVNREQPYELVAKVVAQLRQVGINRINLDLMYGLPYQTVESVVETAELAITLNPQRLAVFGYAHVPWMRKHQRVLDEMPLPGPEERIRMFEAMRAVFFKHGYTAIGIDHYARKNDELSKALQTGTLKRNFQGYTTDTAETLIAFGLSAISALPAGYAQNTSSIHDYRKMLDAGIPTVARGLTISSADRMRREIICQLMCYYKVNLQQIAHRHGQEESFFAEKTLLREFQAKGLVELNGEVLTATVKGRPYIRAVCAIFDQYLQLSQQRFSLAV
ncbi:MAG TPA: oxygen-independent coproporphyrinogen III oxidase [Gammaproteobacteria bacterium]